MTNTQEIKYLKVNECSTDYVTLHIAGDYEVARQVAREFTFKHGACFELTKVDYCYTGGLESGLTARIIAYPRFPKSSFDLFKEMKAFADILAEKLCQKSFTIETKTDTFYYLSDNPLHAK